MSCSEKGLSDDPVLREVRPTVVECRGGLEEGAIFRQRADFRERQGMAKHPRLVVTSDQRL